MKKTAIKTLLVAFCLSCFSTQAKVQFTKDGFIDIDGIQFALVWADSRWRQHRASAKPDQVWRMTKCTPDEVVFAGSPPDGNPGTVVMKLTPGASENQYVFTADAKFSGEGKANFFGISAVRISVADFGGTQYVVNGKKFTFNKDFKKYFLWVNYFDQFKFATKSGYVSLDGKGHLHMQDNRRWRTPTYAMRIGFNPDKGSFSESSIKLTITVFPERTLGNVNRPPYILKEDKVWAAVENRQDVVPGSALDFSGRFTSPAGTKGFAKIKGDKFYFEKEPDKPVKFYGTNLVGTSQVITKERSEILAKRLAAFGFNSVRIHHHDNEVCDRKDTRKLDPKLMDNFDYLIYCFKKNGLYITTDVYVSRRGITKLELPKYGPISGLAEYKAFFWIDDDVFQNWKDAARNFYTHVNPYTGLALIDDPVLISLSLVNEGNPRSWWSTSSRTAKLYRAKLAEFRKTPGNAKATMNDFCSYLAVKRYKEMKEYMISLGCKVPLSDQNMHHSKSMTWERAHYDYVDNHAYWDHPKFVGKPWQLPIAPSNFNALKEKYNVPSFLFPTRILGVPFFVTEFDYAGPNIHRLHGPAFFASYAAFQDWDGLFQFAYSHNGNKMYDLAAVGNYFDLSSDPAKALAHKLAARIFLHGQVKPSPYTVALYPPRKDESEWGTDASSIGFVAKIGSDVGKPGVKSNTKLYNSFFKKKNALAAFKNKKIVPDSHISSSGKLFWTPQLRFNVHEGSFRLTAPGAEVITLQAKGKLAGKRLTVNSCDVETTVGIIPHDTNDLSTAKRMTLIHLTDMHTTGRYFVNNSMSQMNSWGKVPFLVKRGLCSISLKLPGSGWKIYSLGLDGVRKKEIPYTVADGKINLTLNTADQLACELIRE